MGEEKFLHLFCLDVRATRKEKVAGVSYGLTSFNLETQENYGLLELTTILAASYSEKQWSLQGVQRRKQWRGCSLVPGTLKTQCSLLLSYAAPLFLLLLSNSFFIFFPSLSVFCKKKKFSFFVLGWV